MPDFAELVISMRTEGGEAAAKTMEGVALAGDRAEASASSLAASLEAESLALANASEAARQTSAATSGLSSPLERAIGQTEDAQKSTRAYTDSLMAEAKALAATSNQLKFLGGKGGLQLLPSGQVGELGDAARGLGDVSVEMEEATNGSKSFGKSIKESTRLLKFMPIEGGGELRRFLKSLAPLVAYGVNGWALAIAAAAAGFNSFYQMLKDKDEEAQKSIDEQTEKVNALRDAVASLAKKRQELDAGGADKLQRTNDLRSLSDLRAQLDRANTPFGERGIAVTEEIVRLTGQVTELERAGFNARETHIGRRLEELKLLDLEKEGMREEVRILQGRIYAEDQLLQREKERKAEEAAHAADIDATKFQMEAAGRRSLLATRDIPDITPQGQALLAEGQRIIVLRNAITMREAYYDITNKGDKETLEKLRQELRERERNIQLLREEAAAADEDAKKKREQATEDEKDRNDKWQFDLRWEKLQEVLRKRAEEARAAQEKGAKEVIDQQQARFDALEKEAALKGRIEAIQTRGDEQILVTGRLILAKMQELDQVEEDQLTNHDELAAKLKAEIKALQEQLGLITQLDDAEKSRLSAETNKGIRRATEDFERQVADLHRSSQEAQIAEENARFARELEDLEKHHGSQELAQKGHETRMAAIQAQYAGPSGRRRLAQENEDRVLNVENSGNPAGDFAAGFEARMQTIQQNVLTLRQMGAEAATEISDKFADAFTSFAMGTKSASEAFRQMAASILQDLAAMYTKQAMLQLLSGIFSPANSSNSTSGQAASGIAQLAASAVGGTSETKSARKGDVLIFNVRDQGEADYMMSLAGSEASATVVAKGTGRPGVNAGTITPGRR